MSTDLPIQKYDEPTGKELEALIEVYRIWKLGHKVVLSKNEYGFFEVKLTWRKHRYVIKKNTDATIALASAVGLFKGIMDATAWSRQNSLLLSE